MRGCRPLPGLLELDKLYVYCPSTGDLTLRATGELATRSIKQGYLVVRHGSYYAHRIIWKMMTGRDPRPEVDHRDNCTSNNRWLNLREATSSQNRYNQSVRPDSKSGHTGVCRKRDKWAAYTTVGRKHVHLGHFETIEEAVAARTAAISKIAGEFRYGQN